jgi:hypothetical protein
VLGNEVGNSGGGVDTKNILHHTGFVFLVFWEIFTVFLSEWVPRPLSESTYTVRVKPFTSWTLRL